MDVMQRRRELLANQNGRLIFWLSGNDAPKTSSNGTRTFWPLRVGPTMWFILYGEASYDSDMRAYVVGETDSNYIFSGEKQNLDMGNHFRIEYDMFVNRSLSSSKNAPYWFDIGSVGNASKAIGFCIGSNTSTPGREGLTVNWKLNGNNSSPFSAPFEHPALPLPKDGEYHHVIGCNSFVDGGDGYDRYIVTINGLTKVYDTQVPKVHYGPTWNGGALFIGKGWNSGYNCACKIRDIKIFVID